MGDAYPCMKCKSPTTNSSGFCKKCREVVCKKCNRVFIWSRFVADYCSDCLRSKSKNSDEYRFSPEY